MRRFTTLSPALSVDEVTATTARLTIANWTDAWHYKYTAPDGGQCSPEVAAGTSTAEVTGLIGAAAYTFAAYSDSGCSTLLATTAAFDTSAPGPVPGVVVDPLDRALRVSWTAVPGAAGGYEVQWKSRAQDYGAERRASVLSGTSYTIAGLDNAVVYSVRVRASNGGAWSAEATGMPGAKERARLAGVNAALAPVAARAFAGSAARAVSGRIGRALSGGGGGGR